MYDYNGKEVTYLYKWYNDDTFSHMIPRSDSSPLLMDTDDDGLSDYEELHPSDGYTYSLPNDPDSDDDGLYDGWATQDSIYPWLHNKGERTYNTNPTDWDTDGDGMSDGWEVKGGGREGFDPLTKGNAFAITLVITCEWTLTDDEYDKLRESMRAASNYLYDVTDGCMWIGSVYIFDDKEHWDDGVADIRIHDRSGTFGALPLGLFMNDIFVEAYKKSEGRFPLGTPGWYGAMTHELGHYVLGLDEEYPKGDATGKYITDDGTEKEASIMRGTYEPMNGDYYLVSELSTWHGYHYGAPAGGVNFYTCQIELNHESCWETFFRTYEDIIFFDLNNDGQRDDIYDVRAYVVDGQNAGGLNYDYLSEPYYSSWVGNLMGVFDMR